jgi:multidrug efflux pump subunit AcrB
VSAADPATVGQVNVELVAADEREARGMQTSTVIVDDLRRRSGGIAGAQKIAVAAQGGGPQGADVEIRIRCEDDAQLERAVQHVRDVVGSFDGVTEIEDDLRSGKLEARLRLLDGARALGLTTRDLALEIRHAYFGFEAQDLQEADEEVTVRVVLPEAARRGLADLARLRISTPRGGRVPLSEITDVTTARGYASLSRVDGKRAITLKAEVEEASANVAEVTASIQTALIDVEERFPGVTLTYEGSKKESAESMGSLRLLFPAALLMIYSILAMVFRSYIQPVLVMAAIPYAVIGAIAGHLFAGYPFTLLSMIGAVALAGIVVNDSLILVDQINRLRRAGAGAVEAIVGGARTRMRAILLTSITTVLGLAPIMLERSFQAQFLIPMAVSIVYGLAFATVLTLVFLPVLYLILEDFRGAWRWLRTGVFDRRLPE